MAAQIRQMACDVDLEEEAMIEALVVAPAEQEAEAEPESGDAARAAMQPENAQFGAWPAQDSQGESGSTLSMVG